jgi:hypothetical protein
LGTLIVDLICEQSCDFEFRGLDKCVKLLMARKAWSRECDALRAEIINFTRTQTVMAAGEKEVSFALA